MRVCVCMCVCVCKVGMKPYLKMSLIRKICIFNIYFLKKTKYNIKEMNNKRLYSLKFFSESRKNQRWSYVKSRTSFSSRHSQNTDYTALPAPHYPSWRSTNLTLNANTVTTWQLGPILVRKLSPEATNSVSRNINFLPTHVMCWKVSPTRARRQLGVVSETILWKTWNNGKRKCRDSQKKLFE